MLISGDVWTEFPKLENSPQYSNDSFCDKLRWALHDVQEQNNILRLDPWIYNLTEQ